MGWYLVGQARENKRWHILCKNLASEGFFIMALPIKYESRDHVLASGNPLMLFDGEPDLLFQLDDLKAIEATDQEIMGLIGFGDESFTMPDSRIRTAPIGRDDLLFLSIKAEPNTFMSIVNTGWSFLHPVDDAHAGEIARLQFAMLFGLAMGDALRESIDDIDDGNDDNFERRYREN